MNLHKMQILSSAAFSYIAYLKGGDGAFGYERIHFGMEGCV